MFIHPKTAGFITVNNVVGGGELPLIILINKTKIFAMVVVISRNNEAVEKAYFRQTFPLAKYFINFD